MRKFDTKIQYLKYKVLREVARYGFEDNLDAAYYEIPKLIVKEKPTMRCCIYKERAIVEERIKLAMGGDKKNPNVIEVIEIACDECPVSGHVVTESCRGCLAHRCEDVCRRGAITFAGYSGGRRCVPRRIYRRIAARAFFQRSRSACHGSFLHQVYQNWWQSRHSRLEYGAALFAHRGNRLYGN